MPTVAVCMTGKEATNIRDSIISMLFKAGLWIRIHFLRIRIRIQSLMLEANTDPDPNPDPDPDPNPIRIQGLNDQKLKKNYH